MFSMVSLILRWKVPPIFARSVASAATCAAVRVTVLLAPSLAVMLLISAILLVIVAVLLVMFASVSLMATCSFVPSAVAALLKLLASKLFAIVSAPTLTLRIALPKLVIGVMLVATSLIVPETVAL